MTNVSEQFFIAITVTYVIAMAIVFFKAVRHFYGWFINSTPPMGKLGPFVEGFTMFFPRYLTKEGIVERNNCIKWFSVAFVMGVSFFVVVELAGSYAT
jgi:hypothetical protein